MNYTTVCRSSILDLIGGFYDPSENVIYYANDRQLYSVQLDPTSVISSNIVTGIPFGTSTIQIDGNNDSFDDLKIADKVTKKELQPLSSSFLATPGKFEEPVSGPPWADDIIITNTKRDVDFGTSTLFHTMLDIPYYFLLLTGKYDYMLGLITRSHSLPPMWTLKYQTWAIQGISIPRGGTAYPDSTIPSMPSYAHARLAQSRRKGSYGAIIASYQTSGTSNAPKINSYYREFSGHAQHDNFPPIYRAEANKVYSSYIKLGQLAEYGGSVFVAEGSQVRWLALDVKGDPGTIITPSTPGLTEITSLLVRRDPNAPEGISSQVQIVVADYKSAKTTFWLLSVDLLKPKSGKLEEIKLKNQDGTDYSGKIERLWDLTWANDQRAELYVPGFAPNQITTIRLGETGITAGIQTSYNPIPDPRTVLVASPTQLYVICKNEIGSLRIDPEFDTGYDVLGIGFVPFSVKDKSSGMDVDIIHKTTGLANTTKLQNWPLYVKDLPFGDQLSLMINHKSLHDKGIRYYDVTLLDPTGPKSYPVVNQFTDIRGGAETFTDANAGKYPIRDTPDDWYFPHLAAVIDTNKVLLGKSGVFELRVRFYEEYDGKEVGTTFSCNVAIDNRTPSVEIGQPKVGAVEVGSCGSVSYTDKDANELAVKCTFKFEETGIPYGISTYCGSSYVKDFSKSGTITKKEEDIEIKGSVRSALGSCEAGLMSIRAGIGNSITNGYSMYSHGANQSLYFALYLKKP